MPVGFVPNNIFLLCAKLISSVLLSLFFTHADGVLKEAT